MGGSSRSDLELQMQHRAVYLKLTAINRQLRRALNIPERKPLRRTEVFK